MDITQYFNEDGGVVSFDELQASSFAKGVAGDFNPIHDPGSRRFCVPGDLLFTVLLYRYGVAQSTRVEFTGMLDAQSRITLPASTTQKLDLVDSRDKALLSLYLQGECVSDSIFISQLCEEYVRFSGQTFPDILVPLMRKANTMINPARPMVIYQSMAIDLNSAAVEAYNRSVLADETSRVDKIQSDSGLQLSLCGTDIQAEGRKGSVKLSFRIEAKGETLGSGEKNMLLSGLREFDEVAMQGVIDEYNKRRNCYLENPHAL